jgi:thioredoxin-related protein
MMKKIILSILPVLFLAITYAFTTVPQPEETITGKNVKWMTFEQAVEATTASLKAGKKPKKIFLDIYTDWCGWCKKMDAETFEKPAIAKYLNNNFYPVKFNAEQKDSIIFAGKTFRFIANGRRGYHELAAALLGGKMSYPTVVFAHFNNNNFELLQRIPGYLNVPTFDMIMHYLSEEHYTSISWEDYQKKYQAANQPKAVEPAPVPAPKKD